MVGACGGRWTVRTRRSGGDDGYLAAVGSCSLTPSLASSERMRGSVCDYPKAVMAGGW